MRTFVVDETAEHLIWPDNHPSRVCTATEIACNDNESDTSNLELARALVLQNCGLCYQLDRISPSADIFCRRGSNSPLAAGKTGNGFASQFLVPRFVTLKPARHHFARL